MNYSLKNIEILNGHKDMELISGKAIVVQKGKIADIVDETKIPNNFEVIDCQGKYIMPGLINMHVHMPTGGMPTKKKLDYKKLALLLNLNLPKHVMYKMCQQHAKMQLMSGTTTLRAVGGVLDFDTKLRDEINNGKCVGPRILAANYAISVPDGHMTGSVALASNSKDEAANMVVDRVNENVDFIKLMITGGVLDAKVAGEPGDLKMPKEYVEAAVNNAHELGYKVAAHVEGTEGLEIALECGVDTIEHGGKPNAKTSKLFKEGNSALICTLIPAIPFAFFDQKITNFSDTDVTNGKALFQYMIDCIKDCLDNNVAVGIGTDTGCPYVTHYDFWRELYLFTKHCGVSNSYAIHTATEINSKIAEIDDVTGTIDIGKSADMILLENNPLDSLHALRNPSMVIFKGKIHDNPKVKKYEKVEELLDQVM